MRDVRQYAPWFLAPALVALAAAVAAAEDAPPVTKYYFPETPDQAKAVTATFVGGKGHEWLVGGGWQPDGAVVLVGNVLGPTLSLGAPAEVIGTDAPAPSEPDAPDIKLGDRARPFVIWDLPGATGFLVKCGPDLKRILSVHRLPWTAGAITDAAVDASGAVYIAGMATDRIALLGATQETAAAGVPDERSPSRETFVARISADLKRCEWVHRLHGPSGPPEIRLLADGTLWLVAQDVRVFDASGKVRRTASLPQGLGRPYAVSPVDGLIARNASRGNWRTGREPWKCPGVRIVRPHGADLHHLYEWDGPYVGLDNHRSVADTTVQALTYGCDGNLFLYTWSDGGNEVMRFRSTDIRRPHGCRSLPFHWGGTGYNVVKLDGYDYQTIGSTKWRAETARGSGLMRMSTLVALADGSVCIAGTGGDRGVHETTSTLMPGGPTGGNYVAVLSPDLSTALFASMVGGAGEVNTGRGAWNAVSGTVGGRRKHLLLSGAKEANEVNVLAPTSDRTPTRNAMQGAFGGGAIDGYAILLDVPASAGATHAGLPDAFQRLTVEAAATARKPPGTFADEGTAFEFREDHPRFATADAEFRHAADIQAPAEPMDGRAPSSEPVTRDGVSFSIRAARPVFGPGEDLAFDLVMGSAAARPASVPAMKWDIVLEDTWRCRQDAAARGLPASTVQPGQATVVNIRVAAEAFEEASGKGGPAPARLPLGTYRVRFRLTGAGSDLVAGPVEFRIRPYWPNFAYGKPVSGQLTWQKGRLVGSATVRCYHWVQTNGEQARRVLGELVRPQEGLTEAVFTVSDLGELRDREVPYVDAQGRTQSRWLRSCEGKGKLQFAGRALDVPVKCVPKVQKTMPDRGEPGLALDAYFTVKGRDLGLKRLPDDAVDVRIGMRGTFRGADQGPRKP